MRKRKGAAAGVVAALGVLGLVVASLGAPQGCGASSQDVIGRDGGVLVSEDGMFMLEIPPDALSTEVQISIHQVDCGQDHEAACYDIQPTGVVFEQPAMATYEAYELMSMESVSLSVNRDNEWRPLADVAVDREDEIITGSVLYLSSFCVQAN